MRYNNHKAISHRKPMEYPDIEPRGCGISEKGNFCPERGTSFGKERVFDVVNNRLLSGKPMIITTNIPLSVMQKATDLDDRRIYDRILEVCVPVVFGGDSFRKTNAADNMQKAARYLNGASH